MLVGVGAGVGVEIGVAVGIIRLSTEGVAVGTCVLMIVAPVIVLSLLGPMPVKSTQTRIRKRNAKLPVAILAFILHGLNPSLLVLYCQFCS